MPAKSRKYCCICSNFRRKLVDGKTISLHRFPVNEKVKRTWIQRCRLIRSDFKLTNNTLLCSDHFADRNGPSPLFAIPSVFPTKIFKITKLNENFVEKDLDEDVVDLNVSPSNTTDGDDLSTESSFLTSPSDSMLDISLKFHDYVNPMHAPQVSVIRHQLTQSVPNTKNFATQTEGSAAVHLLVDRSTQTENSTCDFSVQVSSPQLTYDDVCSEDSKVFFYTGIPDKKTFDAIFDELKDDAETKTSRKTPCKVPTTSGRPRALRLIDEFFLVMMRLRLGLLIEDLAERFCISKTTCGDIFNRWIDYLDNQLSFLVQWTDKECIEQNMPEVFQRKFPTTRVVIDCTEIRTETPSSLQLKSLLYSDNKSHMTWKALVGISPVGVVTFLSDLWCGSVSDKQITKQSGILELCEPGDGIMADKGFTIADLTTPLGVHLIIPPFRGKKAQFSKRDVQKTRDIANARIHVE